MECGTYGRAAHQRKCGRVLKSVRLYFKVHMDIVKEEKRNIHSITLMIRLKDIKKGLEPVKVNVCQEQKFGQIIVKILP